MLLIITVARWLTGGGDQTNMVILILLIISGERREERPCDAGQARLDHTWGDR